MLTLGERQFVESVATAHRTFHYSASDIVRVYDASWQNMSREDMLISQRLQWALLMSAGLFTTTSFLVSPLVTTLSSQYEYRYFVSGFILLLIISISIIAILFVDATDKGIRAAETQLEYLKKRHNDLAPAFSVLNLPRPFGDTDAHKKGINAALIFPLILRIIWSGILIVSSTLAIASFTLGITTL